MATETQTQVACDMKDIALADLGKRRIEWAFQSMPVLQTIRKQFIKTQPLAGIRVAACLHVTTETANLMITLRDGGASIVLCASNPLSTQDDVAATLVRDYGIPVYAIKGENNDVYYQHLTGGRRARAAASPWTTARTWSRCCTPSARIWPTSVIGGTEETTTGVIRLRAMAKEGVLEYPDRGGERCADQAPVRQSLRHRPEHARRHHPRDQRPAGRAEPGGGRLRLVRTRRGDARARAWART